MKFIKSSFITLILFICSGMVHAQGLPPLPIGFTPRSFVLVCKNEQSAFHLMPLSFYEFQDDLNLELKDNYYDSVLRVAPITFKNFKKDLLMQKRVLTPSGSSPSTAEYDALILPPKDCIVERMAYLDPGTSKAIMLNADYWQLVNPEQQKYFLFELYLQKYLKKDLGSVDYRRFSLFLAAGEFDKFNDEQKIYFLKYYGINEFAFSGISLDLNREVQFSETEKTLQDAFPFPGAVFEGALLDVKRFVTFRPDRSIAELATTTPFSRSVKSQTFDFYIPENESAGSYPYDQRYAPRTKLYPNGQIQWSFIKPIASFYNLKSDIKDSITNNSYKKKYFEVGFYQDGTPRALESYPGSVKIMGKNYSTVISFWHANGNVKETYFSKRYKLYIPSKGDVEAMAVFFAEDGTPLSYF